MRLVIDLTLPTDARLVPRTRRVCSGYLDELGVDSDTADDVVLALDEACANVIRHAFPGRSDETFRLMFHLSPEEVLVVVEDEGVGLPPEPSDAGRTVPDSDAMSGRGLHIIRKLMTSVELESSGSGTRLRMRKNLAPHARLPLVTGSA